MRTSRKTEGKMPTTTRFDLGGGGLPGMPSFSGAGKKLLQITIVALVIILLMASTTSIPTGNVGVLLLFRLDKDKAAEVYQKIGENYAEKIVEPTLRAAIRASTSAHSANALYTNARELVQLQIQDELRAQLAPRGVIVENVLLRDVQLPAMLKGSIEAKQQAEQDALRMSFILQKEKQEAERKRIEAQGISDFQRIVATGISAQLLEWKGIEATEKLATSTNAKIVIIGNPKNGLPLVLEPR